MTPTPDPSAPPTVAVFGGPAPAAPPPGVASGPPRMSPGDFEQAKAAATRAADMAAAPPVNAVDPNKMIDMLGKLTELSKQQQRAKTEGARGAEPKPVPNGVVPVARQPQAALSPEERLQRFAKDGNEYGKRVENFLRTHIPGVNFGLTFEVGESGTIERIRVGSFLLTADEDGGEAPYTLAEVSADTDALGEAIVQVCQATQDALESMDAGELQKDEW